MLSGPILGVTYPWYVWASLVPIVAGCSLSAMKEVSFSWGGFNNAMISNLGMVLRNIYSKKSLNDYKVGEQRVGMWMVATLARLKLPDVARPYVQYLPIMHLLKMNNQMRHLVAAPSVSLLEGLQQAVVDVDMTSVAGLMLLQHIDGINLFGLISIASLLFCVPAAFYMESSMWATAWQGTVEKIGAKSAMQLLALSGLFYHLYNQVGRAVECTVVSARDHTASACRP
jgi:hypothetical protein